MPDDTAGKGDPYRNPFFRMYAEGHIPTEEEIRRAQEGTEVSFDLLNPADLQGRPVPCMEWIAENWIPVGSVTALYGDGGVGKSFLLQMLLTSCSTGAPWCGLEVMRCRSIGFFCEDDFAELHRRQDRINAALGVDYTQLGDARWYEGVGKDNELAIFDLDQKMWPTLLYVLLRAKALSFAARLIIIDTAADVFDGDENTRKQVRRFINLLRRLAMEINGAVVLLVHPSRAGIASGRLDGASTAWTNTVRSRLTLSAQNKDDPGLLTLARPKSNYAATGETIGLRWTNRVLLPEFMAASSSEPKSEAHCQAVFLRLLDRMIEAKQNISDSKNATRFAPTYFASQEDRAGYGADEFRRAMDNLFRLGLIENETYRRNGAQRIVRKAAAKPAESVG